jgi:hypothetical protein
MGASTGPDAREMRTAAALRSFLQGSRRRTPSSARGLRPVAPSQGPRDRRSSTAGSLHSLLVSSGVVNTRMTRVANRWTLVCSAIDGVHRARQRLRVGLHLRRQLADLTRFLDRSPRMCDYSDGQAHQWNSIENPAPVLAEEISDTPVSLGILIRYELVERRYDLTADVGDLGRWNNEDKVIAADVPTKPAFPAVPFTMSWRIIARIRITRAP